MIRDGQRSQPSTQRSLKLRGAVGAGALVQWVGHFARNEDVFSEILGIQSYEVWLGVLPAVSIERREEQPDTAPPPPLTLAPMGGLMLSKILNRLGLYMTKD